MDYKYKYEKYHHKYNELKKLIRKKTISTLKKTIDGFFVHFKNLNSEKVLKDMEIYFKKNKMELGLVKITVKDNKIVDIDKGHFEQLRRSARSRLNITVNMLTFFLSAIKSKINTVFYLTVMDWLEVDDLPIFGFARPKSFKGILIPDWTWNGSYKSKLGSNWIDQVKIIDKHNKIPLRNKKDIVFFQGDDTSKTNDTLYPKTDIRRNLKNASKHDKNYKILIDGEPRSSVVTWGKYKYLLDLPGGSPWSVRLKELFMARSLTIKIDIKDSWVNFYSDVFKPNVDYKQIFGPEQTNDKQGKIKEAKRVKREIDNIIHNISDEEYMQMTNSAYIKMKSIDTYVLIVYFEYLFQKYMELF